MNSFFLIFLKYRFRRMFMRNNYPEDALVVIRRIIRITEINSLTLTKKTKLTPTQMIVAFRKKT